MATVMPEGAGVRKAVQWVSQMIEDGTKNPLPALIEQACVRFNLSPADSEFMSRFFRERQAGESKKS